MKKIYISLILIFSISITFCQEIKKYNKEEFAIKPIWIEMMEDSTVNYYQAIEAYNTYWKGKEKPEWEDPMQEFYEGKKTLKQAKRETRKRAREIREMTQKERLEYDRMCYECKRFEQWKLDNFSYVQEDGRILTESERLKIDEQQRKEMKLHQK